MRQCSPGEIAHLTPARKEKLVAPQCLGMGHDGEQSHAQPLMPGLGAVVEAWLYLTPARTMLLTMKGYGRDEVHAQPHGTRELR